MSETRPRSCSTRSRSRSRTGPKRRPSMTSASSGSTRRRRSSPRSRRTRSSRPRTRASRRRRRTSNDTQERVNARIVSTNDVTRAQIDLANAQHEVENDKGHRTSRVRRARVHDQRARSGEARDARPRCSPRARSPVPQADSLVKLAIATRPDLASKRHLAFAAHDFAREPLLRLIPTLERSSARFALSTDETIATHGFYNTEQLGLALAWPLFDGGARYADKRSRDAQAAIADLTTDTLVRTIDAQVREAAVRARRARRQRSARRSDAVDAAQQSADETDRSSTPGPREGDRARRRERLSASSPRSASPSAEYSRRARVPRAAAGDGRRPARNGAHDEATRIVCVARRRLLGACSKRPTRRKTASGGATSSSTRSQVAPLADSAGAVRGHRAGHASTRSSRCRSPRASPAPSTASRSSRGRTSRRATSLVDDRERALLSSRSTGEGGAREGAGRRRRTPRRSSRGGRRDADDAPGPHPRRRDRAARRPRVETAKADVAAAQALKRRAAQPARLDRCARRSTASSRRAPSRPGSTCSPAP